MLFAKFKRYIRVTKKYADKVKNRHSRAVRGGNRCKNLFDFYKK